MKRLFALFLSLALSGCGGSIMTVRLEGQGSVGLAKTVASIQEWQKQVFCPQGTVMEQRSAGVSTGPDPDPMAYPQKQQIRVEGRGEFRCK